MLRPSVHCIRTKVSDGRHNAFEINPTTDVIVRIFPILKRNCLESFSEDNAI